MLNPLNKKKMMLNPTSQQTPKPAKPKQDKLVTFLSSNKFHPLWFGQSQKLKLHKKNMCQLLNYHGKKFPDQISLEFCREGPSYTFYRPDYSYSTNTGPCCINTLESMIQIDTHILTPTPTVVHCTSQYGFCLKAYLQQGMYHSPKDIHGVIIRCPQQLSYSLLTFPSLKTFQQKTEKILMECCHLLIFLILQSLSF